MFALRKINFECFVQRLHFGTFCKETMSTTIGELKAIFASAVEAVEPRNLIRKSIEVHDRHLLVDRQKYKMEKPCRVVGFGKAVLGMAVELERILGDNLKDGIVTVPRGIFRCFRDKEDLLPRPDAKIKFIEGADNNLPDESAMGGALQIKRLAESLQEDDLLIVLISGGGSALLPSAKGEITLKDKMKLIKELSRRGADILELNCVRKKLSVLKGGGLAELAYPARVISLILSDIIDDPLDYIASGPTTLNTDRPDDALKIIHKYSLYGEIPDSIKRVLEEEDQLERKRPAIIDGRYEHVTNKIIGNNRIASEAALERALTFGFQSAILSTRVSGEVSKISKIYSELARNTASVISNSSSKESFRVFLESKREELGLTDSTIEAVINLNFKRPRGVCLIAGGEPTVIVRGRGKGGRNQQLALEFSLELDDNKKSVTGSTSTDISLLSCGTDGIDGPTDAAGAIGTSDLVNNCLAENINPLVYLENNDSHAFYAKYNSGNNLVRIGHTGTNVMDLHILLIKPVM